MSNVSQKSMGTGFDSKKRIWSVLIIALSSIIYICPWFYVGDLAYTGFPVRIKTYDLVAVLREATAKEKISIDGVVDLKVLSIWTTVVLAVSTVAAVLAIIHLILMLSHKRCELVGRIALMLMVISSLIAQIMSVVYKEMIGLTQYVYLLIFAGVLMEIFMEDFLAIREKENATYYREGQGAPSKKRKYVALVMIVCAIPICIAFGIVMLRDRSYYFVALLIIVCSMIPFFMVFESRRPQARELVIIAIMVAIAVAGRTAFFMLPFVKPILAIVIIAGISLGAEAGFLTGALAAFVSNFFFGQGPWTPWQMYAMGIIGFIAGILFYQKDIGRLKTIIIAAFGGIATLCIYGGIMDTASVFMYAKEYNFKIFLSMYVSGFPVNVVHACATVIFLLILEKTMAKKLTRVKTKYGLL